MLNAYRELFNAHWLIMFKIKGRSQKFLLLCEVRSEEEKPWVTDITVQPYPIPGTFSFAEGVTEPQHLAPTVPGKGGTCRSRCEAKRCRGQPGKKRGVTRAPGTGEGQTKRWPSRTWSECGNRSGGRRSHFCIRSFIHSLIQQKFIEGEARTRRFSLRSQVVTSEGVWPSGWSPWGGIYRRQSGSPASWSGLGRVRHCAKLSLCLSPWIFTTTLWGRDFPGKGHWAKGGEATSHCHTGGIHPRLALHCSRGCPGIRWRHTGHLNT